MGELAILNPKKAREKNVITVDLGDGTAVKCRKEDMTLLLFDGRVPMPLLAAVQRMIEMPDASPLERVQALGEVGGTNLVKLLREHVCAVVIEPKVTMEDTGDENTLPVSYFDVPQLMAIWNATAVVPKFTPTEASSFRPQPSPDAPDAVPAVEAVQPEPVVVAPEPEREVISG